jgi:hypothetical protein
VQPTCPMVTPGVRQRIFRVGVAQIEDSATSVSEGALTGTYLNCEMPAAMNSTCFAS